MLQMKRSSYHETSHGGTIFGIVLEAEGGNFVLRNAQVLAHVVCIGTI